MIDEQEEPTAEAEAEEPTADAGGEAEDATVTVEDGPEDGPEAGGEDDDGAAVLDIDPAANVETADEPAVSAEELLEMPDAPERWDDSGKIVEAEPAAVSDERAQDAADAGAAAAAEQAGGGEAPAADDE
jgi:hypothetical protein